MVGFGSVQSVMCLVAQWCPTLCDPMDCSLPGSSIHGIFQARILEWVAVPFSRVSSESRDQSQVSCIAGRFITIWASRESLQRYKYLLSGSSGKFCWPLFYTVEFMLSCLTLQVLSWQFVPIQAICGSAQKSASFSKVSTSFFSDALKFALPHFCLPK